MANIQQINGDYYGSKETLTEALPYLKKKDVYSAAINNLFGIADKELSALLARDLLVPIVHNTTFDDLREVSPLLGSRSGLSTIEDSMVDVADKLAELVTPDTILN